MSVSHRGRDIHFDVAGRVIAAQEWGSRDGRPVLALHGWLDNSASFEPIAQHLEDVHLIAVDMAGHGHSSHIAAGLAYNIWAEISDVFAIADELGWQEFSLLGHSRGAIIGVLASGTFPDRVHSITMVDALVPPPLAAEEAPEQLAKSITDVARRQNRQTNVFADIEVAVAARQNGYHKMADASARLIVERGVKPVSEGYTWSSDPRLMSASAFKLTQEHILAFISKVSAKSQLIVADKGLKGLLEKQKPVIEQFTGLEVHEMEGGHFLHMEDQVEAVAALVNNIIK